MPEPYTIAVLSGGIAGLLVRFLKRGFHEVKRTVDFAAAAILLIILAPITGLAALLVKLTSPGPAFFTQVRVGQDGSLFNMIKLRTMYANAENNTGPIWAKKRDSRVTPLGYILRMTHLDEVPQLVNVINGEMSLIGPRPERPYFVNQFRRSIPRYENRLAIRPGITGLAQVRHKYDESIEDVKKKLGYDLAYVENMNWRTDVKIAFLTIGMIAGKNAR